MALVYGFPFVQATFRTSDSATLRDQLSSPAAYGVGVAAVAAVFVAVVWAGRFRGPVVPPMPWIDLVLAAPVDRALGRAAVVAVCRRRRPLRRRARRR